MVCISHDPGFPMHEPAAPTAKEPHKNRHRAPIRPLNLPTLGLTTLGLGFLRPAPGSWGSLPPVGLVFVLPLIAPTGVLMAALILTLIASCIICVVWGRYAELRFGRKDAAEVVIDETAGQCLPLLVLAWLTMLPDNSSLLLNSLILGSIPYPTNFLVLACIAFVLFRAFDTLKPWPARRLEVLPHGWGVLLDDLAAGLYAAVALALIVLIPG